jgi:hypothetical protein
MQFMYSTSKSIFMELKGGQILYKQGNKYLNQDV